MTGRKKLHRAAFGDKDRDARGRVVRNQMVSPKETGRSTDWGLALLLVVALVALITWALP